MNIAISTFTIILCILGWFFSFHGVGIWLCCVSLIFSAVVLSRLKCHEQLANNTNHSTVPFLMNAGVEIPLILSILAWFISLLSFKKGIHLFYIPFFHLYLRSGTLMGWTRWGLVFFPAELLILGFLFGKWFRLMKADRQQNFSLPEFFLLVVILLSIVALAIPSEGTGMAKLKRNMADMRAIGTALETYANDHGGVLPILNSIEEAQAILRDKYIKHLPTVDSWGKEFAIKSTGDRYVVISYGSDANLDPTDGIVDIYEQDIMLSNGTFLKSPKGFGAE